MIKQITMITILPFFGLVCAINSLMSSLVTFGTYHGSRTLSLIMVSHYTTLMTDNGLTFGSYMAPLVAVGTYGSQSLIIVDGLTTRVYHSKVTSSSSKLYKFIRIGVYLIKRERVDLVVFLELHDVCVYAWT